MIGAEQWETLRGDLENQTTAEVRFDRISRALYSTDASVYQIEPQGVVLPKTRADLVRIVQLCAEHRCALTMRGGGTSQAGQAIGPGVIVDTSKYLNCLIELNAAERWARVEPGIVLDELNGQLKAHGLRFAPDLSTASRATIGGMMANNSSGARSVLYGKTIDHVLEQQVVLSDGTVAHFRPLDAPELVTACAGPTLEAACYRTVRDLAAAGRDEIDRRFPKRRSAATTRRVRRSGPAVQPGKADRIRRDARPHVAAKLNLVPLLAASGADDRVRGAARRARRHALVLKHSRRRSRS